MASPLRLGRCLLAPRALARHMARPALSRIPVPRSLGSLPPGHRSFEGERQRRGAAARGGVSARASGAVEGAGYDAAPRKASPPLLDFFATCGPGFEVRPRALSLSAPSPFASRFSKPDNSHLSAPGLALLSGRRAFATPPRLLASAAQPTRHRSHQPASLLPRPLSRHPLTRRPRLLPPDTPLPPGPVRRRRGAPLPPDRRPERGGRVLGCLLPGHPGHRVPRQPLAPQRHPRARPPRVRGPQDRSRADHPSPTRPPPTLSRPPSPHLPLTLSPASFSRPQYTRGRRGGDAVYSFVKTAAPWAEVIPEGSTFSVDSRTRDCTDVSSTQMTSTVTKDAICDALRVRSAFAFCAASPVVHRRRPGSPRDQPSRPAAALAPRRGRTPGGPSPTPRRGSRTSPCSSASTATTRRSTET